ARAAGLARRLLEIEPMHGPTMRAILWATAQQGRRKAVLEAYEAFRTRLRDELGAEPDEATTRLVDDVRSGRTTEAPWSDQEPGDLYLRLTLGDPAGIGHEHLPAAVVVTSIAGRACERM